MAKRSFLDRLIPLRFRKSIPVVHHVALTGAIGMGSPLKPPLTFKSANALLERAFSRLAWLRADPARNAKNALKVLIVFKLLDVRTTSFASLLRMLDDAAAMRAAASMLKPRGEWPALLKGLVDELAGANGPLTVDGESIVVRVAGHAPAR